MSVPHTGRLIARIDGADCRFDGERWSAADAQLAARLNGVTAATPAQHKDIRSLAEDILRRAGLAGRARIREWQGDVWREPLPPGAVD